MGPDDEEIIIDSLDEPVHTTEATTRAAPKRPDPVVIEDETDDDPGEDLKKQLADQKRRTAAAVTRATTAETTARTVEGALHQERAARQTSELSALDKEIEAFKAAADSAASALKAALDAGENDKVVELQRQLARAEQRLDRAEERKTNLGETTVAAGDRRDMRTGGPVRTAPPPQQDPVEAVLQQMSPRTQEWFRNGRLDYITNRRKSALASAVHELAVEQGYTPDTDEYFDFAEQELARVENTTRVAPKPEPKPEPTRRARPTVAAPVDRAGGGGNGGDNRPRVKLTQSEKEMATDGTLVWNTGPKKGQPIGLQEYARRKYNGMKEGRFDSPAAQ